jgi:hypothetical protein
MPEVTGDSHPWAGREAFDATGLRVGKVEDVYLDRLGHRPVWVLVHMGRTASKRVFVPLLGATIDDDGVKLAFTRQQIAKAPRPAAVGTLSPVEESTLYRHYGVESDGPVASGGLPPPPAPAPVHRAAPDRQLPGEMIRSEEELRVTTVSRPAEIVRIRKTVVSEESTLTVSLRREEVRVEHVPVTPEMNDEEIAALTAEAGRVQATELILLQEVPVVGKQVVPYERVTFTKEVVTEERQVTEPVRKERISVEHDPVTEP